MQAKSHAADSAAAAAAAMYGWVETPQQIVKGFKGGALGGAAIYMHVSYT